MGVCTTLIVEVVRAIVLLLLAMVQTIGSSATAGVQTGVSRATFASNAARTFAAWNPTEPLQMVGVGLRQVHPQVHLLLVAQTRLRIGRAPKGTLAASMCRTNIAHQMAKRVLDGTIGNGAPSLGLQIVMAVLLWTLAADVVAAPGALLCKN